MALQEGGAAFQGSAGVDRGGRVGRMLCHSGWESSSASQAWRNLCSLHPWNRAQRPARLPYRRPVPLTTVLPFDESLPLSEPVHADAVDDAGRLLGLEGLV